MRPLAFAATGAALLLVVPPAVAATRTVGPSGTYTKPCAAFAAASDNDVVEIDATGNYAGDVCGIGKNGLTIRGVGGRAKIDAAGNNAQGKAIWVISGNDTTVENIEFTGAMAPDKNGSGIRQEGKNLTVRACVFRDNQDGILAGDNADSHILIERSEFDHNGAGDGQSHNLYINHVGKLTFQFNWSHRAKIGHLLKTRAAENHVLYNRLTGEDGTESYEIDVPNGGNTYVIGNLVQQGAATDNPALLAYQAEGVHAANPGHSLYVVNNTFVNDRGSGTFVNVAGTVTVKAVLRNNVFTGGGTVTNQSGATLSNNITTAPGLVDSASFDYRLAMGSSCIGAGMPPGTANGVDLAPMFVYVHPTGSAPRTTTDVIDVGAYEYGSVAGGDGGASPGTGGTASGGTGSASGGAPSGTGGAGDTGGGPGGSGPANGGTTGTGASTGAQSNSGGSSSGGTSSSGGSGFVDAPDSGAGVSGNDSDDSSGCGCRFVEKSTRGTFLTVSFGAAVLAGGVRRRRRLARQRREK